MIHAHILKRKRGKGRKQKKSLTWYMKWRDTTQSLIWSEPVNLHVKDEQVAREKCSEFVRDKEREAAGILPAKSLRVGAALPLVDQLKEYVADLTVKGKAKMYVYNVDHHIQRLLRECSWKLIADVTPESFMMWRRLQKKHGKTLNDYLSEMGGLFRWMIQMKRIESNPLAGLDRVKYVDESPHRALSPDEVTRLLSLDSPFHLVYLVKLTTGLRRSELKRLIWAYVELNAEKPYLTVSAYITKNNKRATPFLRPDVVEKLRASKPSNARPGDRVFPKIPTMDEFRADCDAAKIEHGVDARGLKVVFHSLRHTLCTDLSRNGVHPTIAMAIMRHSDIKLTTKHYLDNNQLPTVDAVMGLNRESVGTQGGTHGVVHPGYSESHPVTVEGKAETEKSAEKQGKSAEKSTKKARSEDRARSWGTRIRT